MFVIRCLMFNSMLTHGYTPDDLLLSTIISIPKDNRGSMSSSDNYRGISMSNSLCKLFDYILNLLLRNFRYCSDDVKCTLFQSYCTNMYCCQLWFNSTKSSLIKLSTSYNSVLRRLLCISKPYSASNMFVSRGIVVIITQDLYSQFYSYIFLHLLHVQH